MSWNVMNELESHWNLMGERIELADETGLWSIYSHESNTAMFMCIAEDRQGSIKLLNLEIDVSQIDGDTANQVRKYLGLDMCEAITNYDLFMAKCGNKQFVKGANAFLIG